MKQERRLKERQGRWWIVAAVFCAFVAIRLLMVAEGMPPLVAWVGWVVYCGYCLSTVILLVALVRRLRARPLAPLPMLPAQLAGNVRVLVALSVFVIGGTLWREGAFGVEHAVDFHAFTASDHMQIDTARSGTSQTIGDGPAPRMAGREVHCQLSCDPSGQTCETVMSEIQCDTSGAATVVATGAITADEPWCYTPWYKEARVDFSAQVNMTLSEAGTNLSQTMMLDGQIEQDAYGPMSCRAFRQRIGQRIAHAVAGAINDTLREN